MVYLITSHFANLMWTMNSYMEFLLMMYGWLNPTMFVISREQFIILNKYLVLGIMNFDVIRASLILMLILPYLYITTMFIWYFFVYVYDISVMGSLWIESIIPSYWGFKLIHHSYGLFCLNTNISLNFLSESICITPTSTNTCTS